MAVANTQPIFPSAVVVGKANISTANTNRDGTGTLGTVATGGAQGTKIDRIKVKAQGTTTAGMVRLFLHDGTTFYLLGEIAVSAVTPSASVASFEGELVRTDGLPIAVLPNSSWTLRASTHNAETFSVLSFGGDY
jgi:hypothetical protein